MKYPKQFKEPLPILKAIEASRKQFGHHFKQPESPESTYHVWEGTCLNCDIELRVLYNLQGSVAMLATKSHVFNFDLSTWKLYTSLGMEQVVCRKLIAFF